MKTKIAALLLVLVAGSVSAQWHREHRTVIVQNNDWVAPLIIGGVVGAAIASQNQPQPAPPPPVIVQQQIEPQFVVIGGVLYRKQYMVINGVLTEVLVK